MSTADVLRMHAPSAPPELRARVLAQAPAERRTRVRIRPVLVLAAAATLAIGAAVVHGFRASAPRSTALPPHSAVATQKTWTTADSFGSAAGSGALSSTVRSALPAAS